MKKKIFSAIVACLLLGTNGVTALAYEESPSKLANNLIIEFENASPLTEVTPYIFSIERDVTITRTYNSSVDIPDYYPYSIYDDQLQTWLSGNLRLQKITPRGGKYIATFSGKIVGWIN